MHIVSKRITALVLSILSLYVFIAFPCRANAEARGYTYDELYAVASGIIDWKKLDNGSSADGCLINDTFLELAGTTPGDWYPIALGRLGYEDNYDAYLAVIKDVVQNRYKETSKLSSAKATEWHRIALAVLAMGGDPTDMGSDENGNTIDLIADGTYNRGLVTSLGRQGINGWIWGLITLDSMHYDIPENAYYTREDIIKEIICRVLPDGGFALSGSVSDPDITAMAVQALSTYYSDDTKYSVTIKESGKKAELTIQEVIDGCIEYLSLAQLSTGDFSSWGTQNSESTAQVITALCSLGIDPQKDERFIKNGNTLIDGLLSYRMPDGGFIHSRIYDPDNPTSLPNESNTMAGEQALYSIAAVLRQMKGMNKLYDFTDRDSFSTLVPFSKADIEKINALPSEPTTKQYIETVRLLERLKKAEGFDEKEKYIAFLEDYKSKISAIQAEIDSLNGDIIDKLYPFEKMSLKDKKTVDEITKRYELLGEYDKQKVKHWDDVIKTKTKIDNELRAVMIFAFLAVVLLFLCVVLTVRIRKRKNGKRLAMQELAEMYGDEE